MGTWGPGNFENDGALDFLDTHIDQLLELVDTLIVPEKINKIDFLIHIGDYQIMPALEILIAICEGLNKSLSMEEAQFDQWKRQYMQAFDRWASEVYLYDIEERRDIIVKTFERLEKHV